MDMERDKRFYPIDGELFNRPVLPVIESSYIGKGRPPKVSHYKAFCGILYILRTGHSPAGFTVGIRAAAYCLRPV